MPMGTVIAPPLFGIPSPGLGGGEPVPELHPRVGHIHARALTEAFAEVIGF